MRNELYFTTYLTENEHHIVHWIIKEFCDREGFQLIYYRKFKNGHEPMYREVKIAGNVNLIKKFLKDEKIEIGNVNAKVYHNGRKETKLIYKIMREFDK